MPWLKPYIGRKVKTSCRPRSCQTCDNVVYWEIIELGPPDEFRVGDQLITLNGYMKDGSIKKEDCLSLYQLRRIRKLDVYDVL